MNITTLNRGSASLLPRRSASQSDPTPPEAPKDSVTTGGGGPSGPQPPHKGAISDGAKKALIGSACAMGGLTGGYVMGSMAGGLALNNIPRLAGYANSAGIAGAAAGALWGAALYLRNDNDAVGAVVKGSAAGSIGGTVGLLGGAWAGPAMTSLTGSAGYAMNLPLAMALSGSLVGFSINRAGSQDGPSDVVKQAAGLTSGATAGWCLGGAAQTLVANLTNVHLSLGPGLGALAGGLVGLAVYLNADKIAQSMNGDGYGNGGD